MSKKEEQNEWYLIPIVTLIIVFAIIGIISSVGWLIPDNEWEDIDDSWDISNMQSDIKDLKYEDTKLQDDIKLLEEYLEIEKVDELGQNQCGSSVIIKKYKKKVQ